MENSNWGENQEAEVPETYTDYKIITYFQKQKLLCFEIQKSLQKQKKVNRKQNCRNRARIEHLQNKANQRAQVTINKLFDPTRPGVGASSPHLYGSSPSTKLGTQHNSVWT